MHKNITISDLNVEIHGKGNSFKKHWLAKTGIFFVEFLLASVLYCYGIIFSEYALIGTHQYEDGVWTPVLFVCCWSFSEPISRFISEYFEDRKHVFLRYVIGCSTAFLFIGIIIPDSITLYMISGGIVTNMISTHISAFALDKLDMDPKVFEALRQVARAMSLFIMPHCVFLLVEHYEINQVKLIFASFLLNIVPAALLIRTTDRWDNEIISDQLRYQTIGRLTYQMNEMKHFTKPEEDNHPSDGESSSSEEEVPVFEAKENSTQQLHLEHSGQPKQIFAQIVDLNQINNTFYQQINGQVYHFPTDFNTEHTVTDVPIPTAYLNPVNVQSYFMSNGVSILPGIPEENEDEDDDINTINPKRLSRISNKLEEIKIQEQIRKDSIKEVFPIQEHVVVKPEPIDTIEYIPNFKEQHNRMSFMDELKMFNKARHCCHCSPYRKYIWTRRLRMVKDFINDNFLRPWYHALKNLFFYPSLMTKITTNLLSTLYITLAPFMAMQKSWKQSVLFSTENATFLLTYVAFAWCFFLVGLPLILKLNHTRLRIVFGVGLVVAGSSFLILSGKVTNDVITISSLLFGFSYGIITYTSQFVYKTAIGMRPWYLVRGTLEVLSAIFVLIIYFFIYFRYLEVKSLLLLAAFAYYFNAALWFCLSFVKYFVPFVRRLVFDQRSQQEGFFH